MQRPPAVQVQIRHRLDWVAQQRLHLAGDPDFQGKVVSTEREACGTLVLEGQPYRRTLEWNGKPLSGQSNTPSLYRPSGRPLRTVSIWHHCV
jgi:hypothetical protein